MAIVKIGATRDSVTASSTTQMSMTGVSGDSKLVCVSVWKDGGVGVVDTVYWNTTEAFSSLLNTSIFSGGDRYGIAVHYLDNPTAGSYDVDVSMTGSMDSLHTCTYELSGAALGAPTDTPEYSAVGSGTSITESITGYADGITISGVFVFGDENITVDSGETQTRNKNFADAAGSCAFGSELETSNGTKDHGWEWSLSHIGTMEVIASLEAAVPVSKSLFSLMSNL